MNNSKRMLSSTKNTTQKYRVSIRRQSILRNANRGNQTTAALTNNPLHSTKTL